MRVTHVLLAIASLSACNNPPTGKAEASGPVAAAVVPAALSFDGASGDAAQVRAHGERLSHMLGCRGCHKADLEGQWFNDDHPEMGKIYATNLTRSMPTMSDAELEAVLREGKHPTRADLWIMPSETFQRLSAADMAALIAHLRTVKPSGEPTPPPAPSAKALAEVKAGRMKNAAAMVAAYRKAVPPELGAEHALGRYLASNTCSECHGGDLTGTEGFAPDLDVAGTYSDAELATLLSTGKGRTSKDLGLMAEVGKSHFSYLTPRERSALIAYVKARAAR